jgi:hypothetical protein
MTNEYKFYDGYDVTDDCSKVDPIQWTYNAGLYLAGAAFLYDFVCILPVVCSFSVSCFLCLSAVSFLGCFFSWTGGTRRAVWLMLRRWSCSSPRRMLLSHDFAGGLAQALAACFCPMLSAFVFRRWPQALAVVP